MAALKSMDWNLKHIVRATIVGACWGVLLCLLGMLAGVRLGGSLSREPSGFAMLEMVLVVITIVTIACGVVVCCVWAIVAGMQRRMPRRLLVLASAIFGVVLVTILFWPAVTRWRQQVLRADLARFEAVISAVLRYESTAGVAPESLDALIPGYLPEIPRIRSGELVELRYEREADAPEGISELEYDLGHGRSIVLSLWLSDGDSVTDARCQGLPDSVGDRPFDSGLWRQDPRVRVSMARAAMAHVIGMVGRAGLDSLLGVPTWRRGFGHPRWALILRRDPWRSGPEYYVFSPDDRRPSDVSGTRSPRVGRWMHYIASSDD